MSTAPLPILSCPAAEPRPGLQGIQRTSVLDGQAQILVTFYLPLTADQQITLLSPRAYSLTGGRRLFPRVLAAVLDAPAVVRLTLDTEGDFSIYTLTASALDLDPLFASHKLRFRLNCDDRFDCRPGPGVPSPLPEIPVSIDYLAKDYASFRQALLDFVPTRLPEWTERSEADIGIMLLELMAYAADSLSYMQDRVANEAFLSSATQRRSVAGHLALIGYEMDQGAAAHTWLRFTVSAEVTLSADSPVSVGNTPSSANEPVLIFETMSGARLLPAHNDMPLYQFGSADCCLPASALSATLEGSFDRLQTGDYLLFDGPGGRRDVVRLSAPPRVTQAPGTPAVAVTVITWSASTPLRYEYCANTARVRGNLVLATHGESVTDGPVPLAGLNRKPRIRLPLRHSPLAYLDTATLALLSNWKPRSAASFTASIPRSASTLRLTVDSTSFTEKLSLLESGAADPVFRLEVDDQGQASIVFGDGTFGVEPPSTAVATPVYRVGGGTIGNLGADTLTLLRTAVPNVTAVTNPLPATGGRNLESRDHARRVAPPTFQKPLVAVTAGDYQAAAESFTGGNAVSPIQRASASFRWTGSWLTVLLAVDPRSGAALDTELKSELLTFLNARRMAGYDVSVVRAIYVPVELELEFCPLPGFLAAGIAESLQTAFSAGPLPGGAKGFFHPDNFTFGDPLYASRIYAAASAVAGVESVRIARLARLHAAQPAAETADNLDRGFLAVGADQIVRLDNDRNFPENGTLVVRPRGVAL